MSMHAPRSPNPIDIHVGGRIRLRRQVMKLSQEKLGESLGITFQQVQKYERGANRVGASRLWRMSEVLNVPIGFFFEGIVTADVDGELAENEQSPIIYDFINSADGMALAEAVSRIQSKTVRRKILDLARSLADEEETQ